MPNCARGSVWTNQDRECAGRCFFGVLRVTLAAYIFAPQGIVAANEALLFLALAG